MVRGRCAPHIYRRLHQDGVSLPAGTRGCLAGRSYMRVDPEGNVSPCPYMSLSVGNIKEQSLTSIWEGSPVLNQLRQGAYHGRCGACEYREFCGGCRARALADSGDLLGEDPLCAYVPSGGDRVTPPETLATNHVWDERAQERIKKIPRERLPVVYGPSPEGFEFRATDIPRGRPPCGR